MKMEAMNHQGTSGGISAKTLERTEMIVQGRCIDISGSLI